jgi:hypothetical protein
MSETSQRRLALLLSIGIPSLTVIPYLVAAHLAAPDQFAGFLLNPVDGFSYLAKLRQGAEGSWLYQIPYGLQSGPGGAVFVFYLLLGHLQHLTGLSPLQVLAITRILGASWMFWLCYRLLEGLLPGQTARWTAFFLILVGSGWGWLGIAFGRLGNDLWVVESIPFLTALISTHFPFAVACVLLAVLAVARRIPHGRWVSPAAGFFLAAIYPFALIPLAIWLAVWLGLESLLERRGRRAAESMPPDWISWLGLLAGALPWAIYDTRLVRFNPAFSAFNRQNLTPSSGLVDTLVGYGSVLALAILGAVFSRQEKTSQGRMLLAWSGVTGLLLFAPYELQRRFALGLFIPLASLAGSGFIALRRWSSFSSIAALVLVLAAVPSNAVVLAAGLSSVAQHQPMLVIPQAEAAAYGWLESHGHAGQTALAGPIAGLRIPAYSGLRTVYGHPFETPDAQSASELMRSLYTWDESADEGVDQLNGRGIQWVFYGPEERALGVPSWLERLTMVYDRGGYAVLQVKSP